MIGIELKSICRMTGVSAPSGKYLLIRSILSRASLTFDSILAPNLNSMATIEVYSLDIEVIFFSPLIFTNEDSSIFETDFSTVSGPAPG
jgi:hypothetical protein